MAELLGEIIAVLLFFIIGPVVYYLYKIDHTLKRMSERLTKAHFEFADPNGAQNRSHGKRQLKG